MLRRAARIPGHAVRVTRAPNLELYSGPFPLMSQPAAVAQGLVVWVSNPTTRAATAAVVAEATNGDGGTQSIIRTALNVPALTTARAVAAAPQEAGVRNASVSVALSSARLVPSAAIMGTFSGDSTQFVELYVPNTAFAASRRAGPLSSPAFPIPNLPAGQAPDLRLYVQSIAKAPGLATFTVFQVDGTADTKVLQRTVNVAPGATAEVIEPVDRSSWSTLRLVVELSRDGLLPSAALVRTFMADGGEETMVWLPPTTFVS